MRAGRLFALAAVEIDIDGVPIEIHGIRAMHVPPAATRIELPSFRDANGRSQAAIMLPEEVRGPIGEAGARPARRARPFGAAAKLERTSSPRPQARLSSGLQRR